MMRARRLGEREGRVAETRRRGIVNPLQYGLENGKDLAPMGGSAGPLALRGYRVRNYTPCDVYLRTTPLVSANIERSLLERNVFVSTTSARNLNCARFTRGANFDQDRDDIYQCAYDNRVNHTDIIVVVTAICFDVQPQ